MNTLAAEHCPAQPRAGTMGATQSAPDAALATLLAGGAVDRTAHHPNPVLRALRDVTALADGYVSR